MCRKAVRQKPLTYGRGSKSWGLAENGSWRLKSGLMSAREWERVTWRKGLDETAQIQIETPQSPSQWFPLFTVDAHACFHCKYDVFALSIETWDKGGGFYGWPQHTVPPNPPLSLWNPSLLISHPRMLSICDCKNTQLRQVSIR